MRYVGAVEASRRLGVQRATLYAYVSRGLVERRVAVDGRTSLYSVDDIDALASRRSSRDQPPHPSLDVQVATSVTTLGDDGVRYWGHSAARLAGMCTFEQVAELLWTGVVPTKRRAVWSAPSDADVRTARRAAQGVKGSGVRRLVAIANALDDGDATDPPAAARRLLTVIPRALSRAQARPDAHVAEGVARRLAECWVAERADELAPAIERAMILLADHELATSTMAVRLAASVRASACAGIVAGLAVLQGPLHGGASQAVAQMLAHCERAGVVMAFEHSQHAQGRPPGFGHSLYPADDPRFAPLLEAVEQLPDRAGRLAVVRELITVAGVRLAHRPNVDLALGALLFVGDLPPDAPIFAIARIAGFAAHAREELGEPSLRYRGMAASRPGERAR